MELVANILLVVGAFAVAAYCHILSGRLKRFNALESGMGGAIAVLSAQVDDMTRAIAQARAAATGSADGLSTLVVRAEAASARIELLLASLHDLPESGEERRLRVTRRRVSPPPEYEAAE